MIYEHSDLSVGPYRFGAYAFAPSESQKTGSIGAGKFSVRFQKGNSYRALFLQYVESQSLELILYSVDDVKDGLSQIENFSGSMFNRAAIQIETVRAELSELAKANGLHIAMAALGISDTVQEDASFAMLRVLMAGIPPLVMIENGHYHFPVRSGIPLGINDLQIPLQSLELPVQASIYIHTPIDGPKEYLKEMHSMLPHFNSELIPEGVLLLGLHLKKANS
jgi:hypothetical protein